VTAGHAGSTVKLKVSIQMRPVRSTYAARKDILVISWLSSLTFHTCLQSCRKFLGSYEYRKIRGGSGFAGVA